MSPLSRSVASVPAAAFSSVCSPIVETRAANSTSESCALERTSSTVMSERNLISGASSLTTETVTMAADTGETTYRSAVNPWIAIGVTLGVILLATVLASSGRRRPAGRAARGTTAYGPGALPGLDALGDYATLVQFSTEYCATCPGDPPLLGEVAATRTGVTHVDVDLTLQRRAREAAPHPPDPDRLRPRPRRPAREPLRRCSSAR